MSRVHVPTVLIACCILAVAAPTNAAAAQGQPAQPQHTVAGTITDQDGKPIADAGVVLLPAPCSDSTARSTTTDDAGAFRFAQAPHAAMQIIVKRPPDGTPWLMPALDPDDASKEALAGLALRVGKGISWAARVTDTDGSPIEAADVQLVSYAHYRPALDPGACPNALGCRVQTNAQGIATFRALEPGDYVLAAKLEGYGTLVENARCYTSTTPASPHAVTLEPGNTLMGKVTDGHNQPVEGAIIYRFATLHGSISFHNYHMPVPTAVAQTDNEGQYEMRDLPKGPCSVVVAADGYATEQYGMSGTFSRDRVQKWSIRLTPTHGRGIPVTGFVTDGTRPIAGATVLLDLGETVSPGPAHGVVSQVERTTSDERGMFRFDNVMATHISLRASKPGYMPAREHAGSHLDRKQQITLKPITDKRLVGTVRNAETGDPIDGAHIYCLERHSRTISDAGGIFVYPRPSSYERYEPVQNDMTLVAFVPGLATPEPVTVHLLANEPTRIDLALAPALPVYGVAIDQSTGEPVSDATIFLKHASERGNPESDRRRRVESDPFVVKTDVDGTFSFPSAFNGSFRLVADVPGFLAYESSVSRAQAGTPIRVELDRGATFAGIVQSPDGQPEPDRSVSCEGRVRTGASPQPGRGYETARAWAKTDETGRFCLTGLPAGRYTIKVSAAWNSDCLDIEQGPFIIDTGQHVENIALRLQEGGRISATVLTPDGEPVPEARAQFRIARDISAPPLAWRRGISLTATADDQGTCQTRPLLPGRYRVSAQDSDARLHDDALPQLVDVIAGETTQVTVRLRKPVEITGTVVDTNGTPLRGVPVRDAYRSEQTRVLTDATGAFRLGNLASREYTLEVGGGSLVPLKVHVVAPAEGLEIVLERSGSIAGRVIDKTTRQEVGAVEVGAQPIGWRYRAPREPQGRGPFWLDGLNPGTYRVVVRAKGYAPAIIDGVQVEPGRQPTQLLVELERGITAEFHVTSKGDGLPLAGARIRSMSRQGFVPYDERDVTDAQGRYAFQGLPPSTYTFLVEHGDFPPRPVEVDLRGASDTRRIDVKLGGGATVRGRIIAKGSGKPIPFATVRLGGEHAYWWLDAHPVATDAEGQFAIEAVPPGTFALVIEHNDYGPAEKEFVVGETDPDEITVELGPGARIAGTVTTPDGAPLLAATVMLYGKTRRETCVDAAGNFEFGRLPPGAYTIHASPYETNRNYREDLCHEVRNIAVTGEESIRQDFVLGGKAVYGTITRDGRPLHDARVMISRPNASLLYRPGLYGACRTDQEGQYRIDGLPPGPYRLSITFRSLLGAGSERVVFRDVEMGSDDVQSDVDLAANTVSGTVVDEQGDPIPSASIAMISNAGAWGLYYTESEAFPIDYEADYTRTDSKGRFELEDVENGSFLLYAVRPGYAVGHIPVETGPDADTSNMKITLRKQADVVLTVHEPDGQVPEFCRFLIAGEDGNPIVADAVEPNPIAGEIRLWGVGPGPHVIFAIAGYGGAASRVPFTARTGEVTRVEVTGKEGSNLHVSVADEAGEPIVDARVVLSPGGSSRLNSLSLFVLEFHMHRGDTTNADGVATVEHVGAGEWELTVDADNYERAKVTVRVADEDQRITVKLAPKRGGQ